MKKNDDSLVNEKNTLVWGFRRNTIKKNERDNLEI